MSLKDLWNKRMPWMQEAEDYLKRAQEAETALENSKSWDSVYKQAQESVLGKYGQIQQERPHVGPPCQVVVTSTDGKVSINIMMAEKVFTDAIKTMPVEAMIRNGVEAALKQKAREYAQKIVPEVLSGLDAESKREWCIMVASMALRGLLPDGTADVAKEMAVSALHPSALGGLIGGTTIR